LGYVSSFLYFLFCSDFLTGVHHLRLYYHVLLHWDLLGYIKWDIWRREKKYSDWAGENSAVVFCAYRLLLLPAAPLSDAGGSGASQHTSSRMSMGLAICISSDICLFIMACAFMILIFSVLFHPRHCPGLRYNPPRSLHSTPLLPRSCFPSLVLGWPPTGARAGKRWAIAS
jgi:hypothetical protein